MSASLAFDLTVEDVVNRIHRIKLVSIYDSEESSYALAELQEDILRAIADGTENPYDLAYTYFQELDKTMDDPEEELDN